MKKLFLAMIFCVVVPMSALAIPVDLELSLLVDVSGSVSSGEYTLQMDGYGSAFRNAAIQSAITGGAIGSIAVNVIQWSSSSQQSTSIDWTQLSTFAEIGAFADSLETLNRAFVGNTSPSSAINYAVPLFTDNGYEGTRTVIDVSGDGTGSSTSTQAARDAAYAAGITINGVAIGSSSIETWYQDNITTPDGFTVLAATFGDFENAISEKILREVTGSNPVPEPATMMLFGIGLLGLAGVNRRKK